MFGGGDTNLFGYVAQDPVNWVDPDGLSRSLAGPNLMEGAGGAGAAGGSISGADLVKAILAALANVFNDQKLSPWEIDQLRMPE